ncbi:hypothetical protein [Paraburkholderia bannensis]|uniref:hypothetical protein n=1 Tax=Paraburkholderia bannensis TaxID=765414 RepID=UPI002AB091FA|nr:hypothetical protein [Paraburkholderia bannensis]
MEETRFARLTVAFVEILTAAVLRRVAFFFGGAMTLASRSKPRSQTLDFFLGMAWAVTAKRRGKNSKEPQIVRTSAMDARRIQPILEYGKPNRADDASRYFTRSRHPP